MATQNFRVRNGLEVGTGVTISSGIISATSIRVSGDIQSTSGSSFSQLNVTGFSTFAGITTVTGPTFFSQQLNISGVSTHIGISTFQSTIFGSQSSFSGIVTASSFIKTGGTSSQFLKADGSSDSNTYLTTTGSAVNLTALTGASANTYGNATAVPQIVVDSNGRITGISNVLISTSGGGGTSLVIKNNGSLVGTAGTVDFGTGLAVSPVSAGIVTVTVSGISTQWTSTTSGIVTTTRVAIGTVTFAQDEDTDGTLLVRRNTGLARIRIRNDSTNALHYASFNLKTPANNGGWSIYTNCSSNYLRIWDGQTVGTTVHIQDGKFGIINTSPTRTLDVTGDAAISSGLTVTGVCTATTFSGSGASLTSIPNSATTATNANTASAIVARDGSGNFSAGTITATLSGNATTATTASALNTGNNYQVNSFGVGTAASGTAGEIRATNNITAYYSSDINLKTNIEPIDEPLKKLLDITGVRFEWTDECIENRGGEDGYFVRKNDIGVIAQEIEKVLPEAVATREDGYKAVRYELLIPLLIESVKEQQKQIEELKNIIKEKL